jgi:hypothetical protein
MARVTGLEPATSGVTGRHSNQLSYTRTFLKRLAETRLTNLPRQFVERLTKAFVFECQASFTTKE